MFLTMYLHLDKVRACIQKTLTHLAKTHTPLLSKHTQGAYSGKQVIHHFSIMIWNEWLYQAEPMKPAKGLVRFGVDTHTHTHKMCVCGGACMHICLAMKTYVRVYIYIFFF